VAARLSYCYTSSKGIRLTELCLVLASPLLHQESLVAQNMPADHNVLPYSLPVVLPTPMKSPAEDPAAPPTPLVMKLINHCQIPFVWQYSASVEQLLTKRDVLDISLTSTSVGRLVL